jgi:hypothetical protein
MKTTIKYSVIYIGLTIASILFASETSAQRASISFQVFYDQLSPHGHWVDNPGYGYVWLPNVGPGFTPYATNGYWVMTEYGMTWVSNYSWGWAPFHYGRWEYDNNFGWFWVPDTEWGPAWVVWRQSSDYYGWAPMRPGISITVSFGSHHHHHYDHWVFVRYNDIDRYDLHRCYVNRRYHRQIITRSTVINNTYIDNSRHVTYVSGPNRRDIHRTTGRNIRTVSISDNNRPGQSFKNDRLNIYRPRVTRSNNRTERIVPGKTTNMNDIRRSNNRNTVYQNNRTRQSNSRNQETNTNNPNYRKQKKKTYQPNNQTRNQQRYSNQTNRNQQYQRGNNKTQTNNRNSRTYSTSNSNKNINSRQSNKKPNSRNR